MLKYLPTILSLFLVDGQNYQKVIDNQERVISDHLMSLLNTKPVSGLKLEHLCKPDMVTALQHMPVKPTLLVVAKAANSKYSFGQESVLCVKSPYVTLTQGPWADIDRIFSKTEMYTQYTYEEFEGFTQAFINLELENYYYYPELLQVEHKFCTLGNLPTE